MYHCPECSTIIQPAEDAKRSEHAQGGLYLETMYYTCPGCGKQFLHRVREYFDRDPTDEWYHVVAGDQTLLMHNPPQF